MPQTIGPLLGLNRCVARCGSALLWEVAGRDSIAVAMGAFDTPTNIKLGMHIFVADKGDYYELADGLLQKQQ